MDTSKIKEDLMVHAKGEGSMQGASGEHIGTVDGHVPDLLKDYALDTKIGCISSSIQGFLS